MLWHSLLTVGMCIWALSFLHYYFKIIVFFRRRKSIVYFILNWLVALSFFGGSLWVDNYLSIKLCGESSPPQFTIIWLVVTLTFIGYKARDIVLKEKRER